MSFRLLPKPGRVLVLEDEFNYQGNIIIPDKAKRRPTTGKIIAIGEGVTSCEIGEKIVYGLYSGTVVNFKGQPTYRVLGPEEILLSVEGEAELEGVGT